MVDTAPSSVVLTVGTVTEPLIDRGVELGKVLAKACRATIDGSRKGTDASADALKGAGFTSATANLMAKFLA